MTTIYKIIGGFQAVRQAAQAGHTVKIESVDSDWPEKTGCSGVHAYTHVAWDTNLQDLKKEAREWTKGYGKITFQVV